VATWRKTLFTNQLKENLALFLTSKFLDAGYFRNITTGNSTDFNSNDLSKFSIDTRDSSYASGTVWAAPRPNWVYEGDISVPSGGTGPITPSGVFVNSSFKLPNDATYGHVFDYLGGRVIFTSGAVLDQNDDVKASYSYKEFKIRLPDNTQVESLYTEYMSNTGIPNQEFPMSAEYTPAISIFTSDHKTSPLALGGGIILRKNIQIYIIANNDWVNIVSDMADLVTYQFDVVQNMVDVDKIPERINFRGQKSPTFIDYKTLLPNQTYFYNKMEFLQLEAYQLPSLREGWNVFRVDGLVEMRGAT
jgi:hypothetical protein